MAPVFRGSTGLVETVPLVRDGTSKYHLNLVLPGGTGDLFRFGRPNPANHVPLLVWPAALVIGAVAVRKAARRKGRK